MTDIHIDKIVVNVIDPSLMQMVDYIFSTISDLGEKVGVLMAVLDDLRTQVERTTGLEQSAITMIQGLAQQIQDAAGNESAVQELASQLSSNADALAAALAANTPADPNAGGGDTRGGPTDNPDTSVTGDATPGGGSSPADVKV